ncbi:bifunctional diaminohydroxyphosphoribosylaminopyrimidine deaminase/5-amino-6-(5-phosphoribosylamino)uracil reductase RibD [Undibacterium sp. FT137W]|uniref:Riboflavin biosynthesis protein RibD n=2 Tax=Undibacterium fentianense TaxID=2828728 RepID=A0A941E187_9BURK|nr:bifunctional diaminohydroxyphosphoribosylaminopyrimidine deaminase/5-amino-6-(5-phosphoribosylamino)uracil reductase RibD [Undibacterium fentianense]
MRMALELASQATMATSPNPKVGCLIVKDGQILGKGCTQAVGQAHAEVMALRDAANRGHDVRGATAYVTLEPCSHFGRTPPCANALVEAKLARVVAAIKDANPQVAGRGLLILQNAGMQVEVGLYADEARELNRGFFQRMETGRPWVRLKMAASLDGLTALPNGQSQWITDATARLDGHHWRAKADVILTGIGTVLSDDPQLTVRLPDLAVDQVHQPRKVIVDSALRTPLQAKILQQTPVTIFHASNDADKIASMQQAGIELHHAAAPMPERNPRVDIEKVLEILGQQQVNDVHIEAGATLSGAFLQANRVDELLLYLAPKLLGRGRSMFDLPVLHSVSEAKILAIHELRQIGEAIRVIARWQK